MQFNGVMSDEEPIKYRVVQKTRGLIELCIPHDQSKWFMKTAEYVRFLESIHGNGKKACYTKMQEYLETKDIAMASSKSNAWSL